MIRVLFVTILFFIFCSALMAEDFTTHTASIKATAQVVPLLGIQELTENDTENSSVFGYSSDSNKNIWIYYPVRDGLSLTINNGLEAIKLDSYNQHRKNSKNSIVSEDIYRSLVCLDCQNRTDSITLTVIYTSN